MQQNDGAHMSLFDSLNKSFNESGWNLVKKTGSSVVYSKTGNELDVFEITAKENEISVLIPLKSVQYRTNFYSKQNAHEYVETRLKEYIY
jgi:hypothetical protein